MGEQGQLFPLKAAAIFRSAPTPVLTISTWFLNIMMPPKPKATCSQGGLGLGPIQEGSWSLGK